MYYDQTAYESGGEIESELASGTGLLPQPSASLPSFIMMIYSCSLCPDLIFQAHVRCGSLGKAFTINKQTLFTWLILQEAMRLKHLERGIHLPHTSKYHPDAIDIYWAMEKTAGVDGLHHVKWCLRKEGMEGRGEKGVKVEKEGLELKNQGRRRIRKKPVFGFHCRNLCIRRVCKYQSLFEVRSDLGWALLFAQGVSPGCGSH